MTRPAAAFAWLNLAAAALAAGIWYLWPAAGGWPLLLGLSPWLLARPRRGRNRWRLWPLPRTRYDAPLLLFFLTAAVSVWAAYDRPAAWAKFWLMVGAWLLLAAFVALMQADLTQAAAWLLAVFGAALALYFLATNDWTRYPAKMPALTAMGQSLQTWLPALPGHRLHPNVAGGLLAMTIPFTAALVADSRCRVVTAGLLLLALSGLLLTAARGAWIALAVAAALALSWRLLGIFQPQPASRRWLLLGLICAGASLGLAVLLLATPWLTRLLAALPGPDSSLSRLELYSDSLSLAADYPLIGAGLGGFTMLHASYALLVHVGYTVHAHNIWLNVAIEQGGLAALALFWLFLLAGVGGWRAAGAGRMPRLPAAALLSLITVLTQGLVDDVFYGSRALLLLFVPLAFVPPFPVAKAVSAPETGWRRAPAPSRRWLLVVLLLALGLWVWRQPAALVWRNLAAVQQSQIELSRYRWPDWPLQDAVRRAVDLSQPVAYYERALSLAPTSASANRRLGQIELSLGRYAAALAHLQAAYRAAPRHNATRQLLGEAYSAAGQPTAGAALWQGVNNDQGQLALRAFWYEYLDDAQRLAWIRQATPASAR